METTCQIQPSLLKELLAVLYRIIVTDYNPAKSAIASQSGKKKGHMTHSLFHAHYRISGTDPRRQLSSGAMTLQPCRRYRDCR